MPALAVALALASAVLHIGWNAALRGASGTLRFVWVQTLAGGSLAALAVPFVNPSGLHAAQLYVLMTIGIHAVYFLALSAAYRTGALALVYPGARGLGLLLTVPAAAWVFGQALGPWTVAGVVLVAAGVLGTGWDERRRSSLAALGWTALVGVTVAGYSLVDSRAVHLVSPVVYIALQFLGTALVLTPAALRTPADRGALSAAVSGAASVASYLLVLYAYRLAPVGAVLAIRQVAPALAPAVGLVWLRERPSWVRALGALGVAAGAALVIWT